MPGGVTSSKAMTLCPVCSFCNFSVAVLPGAMFHTGSCPGSVTKLSIFTLVSSMVARDVSLLSSQPLFLS